MKPSEERICVSTASILWMRRRYFRGLTFTAEDDREAYGERRFLTLGLLEDQVVSVAHTESRDEFRIISIRKATKHEARYYFSQITN